MLKGFMACTGCLPVVSTYRAARKSLVKFPVNVKRLAVRVWRRLSSGAVKA